MTAPGDGIAERFRRGLEEEMGRRALASSRAKWMTAHHEQASKLLAHKGMNWSTAAEAFAASGLQDQIGQTPTAETGRETWKRVETRRRAGMKLRKSKA